MLRETESGKREEEEEAKAVPPSSEHEGHDTAQKQGPPVAEPYPAEKASPGRDQQQHPSEQSELTQTSEGAQARKDSDLEQGKGGTQGYRSNEGAREGVEEQDKKETAEHRPEQTTQAAPAANLDRAKERGKRFFREYGGASLVIVFASFVLMVQSSVLANNPNAIAALNMSYVYYAVSFGVITLILGIIFLVLRKREMLTGSPRMVLVILLFLWCTVGAGIFTFKSPFINTGNGYFMSWIIFLAAFFMLKSEIEQMDKVKKIESKVKSMGSLLFALVLASLVEFFAALALCTNGCSGNTAYAVSVGLISFFIVLIYPFIRHKLGSTIRKVIATFLALWWLLAAFILTFGYPFQSTGNGYFSSWIALFLSVLLLEAEIYG